MDEQTYNKLKEAWDGRAGYILFGGIQYRVLTPNGEDRPVFVPQTDQSLYGSLSTGFPIQPEPKSLGKKPARRDVTDTGGKSGKTP